MAQTQVGSHRAGNAARTVGGEPDRTPAPGAAARRPSARSSDHQRRPARSPTRTGARRGPAANAAGHTHSSRSRTCWTLAVASTGQPLPAGPECRSRAHVSIDPFGHVAVAGARPAGRSAPRPSRRSCPWSGPPASRARRISQRLHADQRQPRSVGQLVQHPPPVPGRLTRHRHRLRTPPARARSAAQSSSAPSSHASRRTPSAARAPASRGRSPRRAASHPPDRSPRSRCSPAQLTQPAKPTVAVTIPARDKPLPSPRTSSSMRWDTKPDDRIRRTFPTPDQRRSTPSYAAYRFKPGCRPPPPPPSVRPQSFPDI